MTAAENRMIPISNKIEYLEDGDCKLVLFSHLLQYYGLSYSPAEIMLAAAGLDFAVYKYKTGGHVCFFVSGRKIYMEEVFANNLGLILQKRKYILENNPEKVKLDCLNEMIKTLYRGNPLFVSVDRFYMEYLKIQRSHMPYHVLIIVGYDCEKKEFTVIDSLADNYIRISADIMIKAMFETSVLKDMPENEWFFISPEYIKNLKKASPRNGILHQINEYTSDGGGLDALKEIICILEMLVERGRSGEKTNYTNFMKYQILMLYTEIHDQDFGHLFYRKLYFEECKRYIVRYCVSDQRKKEVLKCIDADILLWKTLSEAREFGEKFKMNQAIKLVEGLKEIYKVENQIFKIMKDIVR